MQEEKHRNKKHEKYLTKKLPKEKQKTKNKNLHSHGMTTEGVQYIGGSGEVKHKLGRTRVYNAISL